VHMAQLAFRQTKGRSGYGMRYRNLVRERRGAHVEEALQTNDRVLAVPHGIPGSRVQEMSGQEINGHNTSYEGSMSCPAQHERQLTSLLLWPHFQEQMFVELNRQLSIVAG
jgi:hypothetical protein